MKDLARYYQQGFVQPRHFLRDAIHDEQAKMRRSIEEMRLNGRNPERRTRHMKSTERSEVEGKTSNHIESRDDPEECMISDNKDAKHNGGAFRHLQMKAAGDTEANAEASVEGDRNTRHNPVCTTTAQTPNERGKLEEKTQVKNRYIPVETPTRSTTTRRKGSRKQKKKTVVTIYY